MNQRLLNRTCSELDHGVLLARHSHDLLEVCGLRRVQSVHVELERLLDNGPRGVLRKDLRGKLFDALFTH